MNVITDNCQMLLRIYSNNEHRIYWNTEDKETLMVLLQNKLLSDDIAQAMMADLQKCESEFKHQDPGNVVIMDNIGVFLEFCLMSRSLRDFEAGLDAMMESYSIEQLTMLMNMVNNCLQIHLSGINITEDSPFVIRVCDEFLRDSFDNVDESDHIHIGSRMTFVIEALQRKFKRANESTEETVDLGGTKEVSGFDPFMDEESGEAEDDIMNAERKHKRKKDKKKKKKKKKKHKKDMEAGQETLIDRSVQGSSGITVQ